MIKVYVFKTQKITFLQIVNAAKTKTSLVATNKPMDFVDIQ